MTATSGHEITRFTRRIEEVTLADASVVGRKAAFLGELIRAGFPVPDGFVLTTGALEETLHDRPDGDVAAYLGSAPIPDPLLDELRAIADHFGDTPLAVRSSGVLEDLAGSSFAGQYESVLGVVGLDALVAAVRRCWASAFSERVAAYTRGRAGAEPGGSAMAVIVQRLVPAEAAGVCFTVNPVTGRRDETVVSAISGLGERLVSGEASAEEWVVRDGTAERTAGAEQAIDADRAIEVAALAGRVADHFGEPQDVEWACADQKVWLVQARPVTALSEQGTPIPIEVPPGSWTRDPFSRRPWTPLQVSMFQPTLNRTSPRMGTYGFTGGVEYTQIGGWAYTRMNPPQGDVGRHVASMVEAVAADEPWTVIEEWYKTWRPRFIERTTAYLRADLRTLADDALVEHFEQIEALLGEVCDRRFLVSSAGLSLMSELAHACHELLGWDLGQTLRLVTGLPSMTTEPSFRLAEIALAADPETSRRLASIEVHAGMDVRATLAGISPRLADDFDRYLSDYGHRILGIDITEPSLVEQPWVVLQLLVDLVKGGYDPHADAAESERARAAAIAEARGALSGEDLAQFERALRRAERAQPVRDDKAFTIAVVRALTRYVALEMGRRLTAQGRLSQAEDAFFLERDELVRAVQDRSAEPAGTVARRRSEYVWANAHQGPLRYGEPPAAVDPGAMSGWLEAMPPQAREVMSRIFWLYGAAGGGARTATDSGLAGIAASAGRYTGPVRVVRDESEFGKVRNGDVLVCPETTPQWSMLFPKIGALVTDTGGLLSHPAIIAREYRIPAVLATGNGTDVLRDGQIVTVDGSAGLVETDSASTPQ